MKYFLFLLFLLISFISFSQENYNLTIDNQLLEIGLDKTYQIQLEGKTYTIKLTEKENLTYSEENLLFKYPKGYSPTKAKVENGISQIVVMNAEGGGFIVQKYESFDPKHMKAMLLNELTKESINYGFKEERADYQRKLSDGTEIEVFKTILSYKDEVNIYEIATVSNKDEGFILVAMQMNDKKDSETKKLIKLFWNSVKLY